MHGAPDFGNVHPIQFIERIYDLAELAARLGSLQVYERGGNFVFGESFAAGIAGYNTYAVGTGSGVAISPLCPLVGPYAVALTTGDATGNLAWIERSWPAALGGKWGVEFSWSHDGSDAKVHLKLRHYYDLHIRRFGLRLDSDIGYLEYLEPDDTWSELATGVWPYIGQGNFNTMKLVIDLDEEDYVRASVNQVDYAITQHQTFVAGAIAAPILSAEIQAETLSNLSVTIFVDRLVVTQAEA